VVQLNYYLFEYVYHGLDTPYSLPKDQRSADIGAQAKAGLDRHLEILERRLDGRPYVLGDGFTLVDLALASYLGEGRMLGNLSFDAFPRVADWLGRCSARPALGRVLAEV